MSDDTTRDDDDDDDDDDEPPDVIAEIYNDPEWSNSDNDGLIRFYDNGDERTKGTINRVLIAVCGWSLPTLLKMATDPDFYKAENPAIAITPYWWAEDELPEKKP